MKKSLLLAFLFLAPAMALADSHSFLLFGTSQSTYGLHLSMSMDPHHIQAVAQFSLQSATGDFQPALTADRAAHPGRNYILNPIQPDSQKDLFFPLSTLKTTMTFDANIYSCDNAVIWDKGGCFDTWKLLTDRVHVTVTSVVVNSPLTTGAAPLTPAKYQIIVANADTAFAFPLMTDTTNQFDQILSVKLTNPPAGSQSFQVTSNGAGAAKRLAATDKLSSNDTSFDVLSEILFVNDIP